jgi:hypothetical protein
MTNQHQVAKGKILITGDSWSQGEWQYNFPGTHSVVGHTGINQYLIDAGYKVTNVGLPGNHNLQSLESLHTVDLTTFDHCIFFFSDVLRQLIKEDMLLNNPNDIIINYTNSLVVNLEKIKKDFDIKITIVGGCGKCSPTISHSIDYIIPSLAEWLIPEFTDLPYAWGGANWSNILLESDKEKIFTLAQKEQWTNILENVFEKTQAWQFHQTFFYPDGSHANKHAHKLLTDHLIELWNN